MEVIIQPGPDSTADVAFELVRDRLKRKPDLVVGLATGRTPLGLYGRMAESGLDFRKVRFFNLDEFVGPGPDDPKSFHHYLRRHLLDHLNADPSNVRLLRGDVEDVERAAEEYEREIASAGGIDLQVLGLGRNGHIGFNEPGSSLGSRTRPKTLEFKTVVDYAGTFPTPDDVPRFSITMGIGTILEARCLLVMATGEEKAEPVKRVVEGPVTAEVPGSAIQLHPRVHLVVDDAAASRLSRREYWKWVYENKWKVGQ